MFLDDVYEVPVNVLLKCCSNSCGGNIKLYDDVWVVISIEFEAPSQPFTLYLQFSDMVNVILHSHKKFAIFPQAYFFLIS